MPLSAVQHCLFTVGPIVQSPVFGLGPLTKFIYVNSKSLGAKACDAFSTLSSPTRSYGHTSTIMPYLIILHVVLLLLPQVPRLLWVHLYTATEATVRVSTTLANTLHVCDLTFLHIHFCASMWLPVLHMTYKQPVQATTTPVKHNVPQVPLYKHSKLNLLGRACQQPSFLSNILHHVWPFSLSDNAGTCLPCCTILRLQSFSHVQLHWWQTNMIWNKQRKLVQYWACILWEN